MLKYGNRDFRNLQEQVYANMKNIEDIIKGSNIIADLNVLHIVGTADTAADLPDPDTYAGEYGDAIAVGTEEPYDLYIFSKAYENENAPQWFNIGEFPQPGPVGPQGPQGVGIPEIETGDAGKALMVNADEDDAEWTTLPSGLPDIETGDAGKLLAVNASETDAEWITNNSLKLLENAPAKQILVGINTSNAQNNIAVGDTLAIADGEIGVASAVLNKINNSLQLPATTPATQKIVTIGTTGEQVEIEAGANMILQGNVLSGNYLVIDCQNTGTWNSSTPVNFELTEAQYNKAVAFDYDYIILKNWAGTSSGGSVNQIAKAIILTKGHVEGYGTTDNDLKYQCDFARIKSTDSKISSIYGIVAKALDNSGYKLNVVAKEFKVPVSASYSIGTNAATLSGSWSSIYPAAPADDPYLTKVTIAYHEGNTNSTYPYSLGEVDWSSVYRTSSNTYVVGRFNHLNYKGQIAKRFALVKNGLTASGSWTMSEVDDREVELVNTSIYADSTAAVSIGSYTVYKNSYTNEMYIMVPTTALDFKVFDQSNNEITISNKAISDFAGNTSPKIKLLVSVTGGNYYLSGGVYEAIKLNLGFTKPSTAVGSIIFTITTSGSKKLSPNILFAGSDIINSIPMQYNGINRSSVSSIEIANGNAIKLIGSPISFGADSDVTISFCFAKDIVKAIDVA